MGDTLRMELIDSLAVSELPDTLDDGLERLLYHAGANDSSCQWRQDLAERRAARTSGGRSIC